MKPSIWGVWKWSYWIKHGPKPGDRHQDQLSRMFRTKVTNLDILSFKWPKWTQMAFRPLRSIWGVWKWYHWISHVQKHSDWHQDWGSIACSKPKVQIWPFELILSGQMATNGHFGHSDQSEVSGNGTIGFPMYKNIVIDTKIKAQACSKPNLQIWTC